MQKRKKAYSTRNFQFSVHISCKAIILIYDRYSRSIVIVLAFILKAHIHTHTHTLKFTTLLQLNHYALGESFIMSPHHIFCWLRIVIARAPKSFPFSQKTAQGIAHPPPPHNLYAWQSKYIPFFICSNVNSHVYLCAEDRNTTFK